MSRQQGKILVIRGGAIGDFILTLPAIAALRQQFPTAHLEVLGYPHIIPLASAAGLVDRTQSIESRALAGFFARNGELAVDLADYFSEFDLFVSYLYDPDGIFRDNVGRCAKAQFIAGQHRADDSLGLHAAKVYLKALERLAIFDANHVPALDFGPRSGFARNGSPGEAKFGVPALAGSGPANTLKRGQQTNRVKTLALHPGSGSERKNWPEEKWAGLVQHLLVSTESNLLLVGGEAEGERLQRLAAALPPARVQVAQSLPLVELGALLQGCAGFIGHDSGISHLAAAVGLPGLVLWGDTVEKVWRPPSEKVMVLRHPRGLRQLEMMEVAERLKMVLVESIQETK